MVFTCEMKVVLKKKKRKACEIIVVSTEGWGSKVRVTIEMVKLWSCRVGILFMYQH